MRRHTLAGVLVFLGSFLAAQVASALSLGDLSLKSELNQPFKAVIPVRDAGDLSVGQVNIKLASVEDFEKAGVEYAYFLGNLKFTVSLSGEGDGMVMVTSHEPIVEPYLNFLVEARWPTGRMLREYTVLLDLPVIGEEKTAAVEVAAGGVATQAVAAKPAPEPVVTTTVIEEPAPASGSGPQPRSGEERKALPQAGATSEYRVQHDDTLWEIAARVRPSENVSVQQTMLALLRNNPEAFIDNNINRLKSGYVLRLPNEEEANAMSQSAVISEIKRQNAVWRGQPAPAPAAAAPAAGPQLTATDVQEQAPAAAETAPRLSIATGGDSDSESAGGEAGKAAALRNQLSASRETADKLARENAELQSRLADLEGQMATLQRLLEVKDNQLSALQQAAQQETVESPVPDEEAAEEAAAEAALAEEAPGEEMAEPVAQPEQPEQLTPPEDMQPPVAVEAPAPPAQPAPEQAVSQPADDGLSGLLGGPNQLLVNVGLGAAILLLLLLLMMYQRRRRAQAEAGEALDRLREMDSDSGSAPAAVAAGALAAEAGADEFAEAFEEEAPATEPEFEGVLDLDDSAGYEDEIDTDNLLADESPTGAEESAGEAKVEAETGDAIAEAEIYVAYGRYDQAAAMLRSAITSEPGRSDLREKLLEIYLDTHDRDNFLREYEALKGLGDDAAVSRVKESMSAVEGVSDWLVGEDAMAPAAEESVPNLDLDFDLDEAAAEEEPTAIAADVLDEGEFSFEAAAEAEETPAAEPEEDDAGDETLSFDLDLDLDEGLGLGDEPEEDLDLGLGVGAESEPEPEPEKDAELDVAGEVDDALDFDLDVELGGAADKDDELSLDIDEAGGEELAEADDELAGGLSFDESLESLDADLGDLGDLDLELGESAAEPTDEEIDVGAKAEAGSAGLDLELDETLSSGGEFDLDLDDLDLADLDTDELETGGLESADLDLPAEPAAPVEPAAESAPAPAAAEPVLDELAGGDDMDDFGLLGDSDEVSTKLDLARAYIDMGDTEGAREMLQEVVQEGDEAQRQEAGSLLERL